MIAKIALYQINVKPLRTFQSTSFHHLLKSIREDGLLSPITLYLAEDNERWNIVSGNARCLAALVLGHEDILAKIVDKNTATILTLTEGSTLRMLSNNQRKEALLQCLKHKSKTDIAAMLNITISTLNRWIK